MGSRSVAPHHRAQSGPPQPASRHCREARSRRLGPRAAEPQLITARTAEVPGLGALEQAYTFTPTGYTDAGHGTILAGCVTSDPTMGVVLAQCITEGSLAPTFTSIVHEVAGVGATAVTGYPSSSVTLKAANGTTGSLGLGGGTTTGGVVSWPSVAASAVTSLAGWCCLGPTPSSLMASPPVRTVCPPILMAPAQRRFATGRHYPTATVRRCVQKALAPGPRLGRSPKGDAAPLRCWQLAREKSHTRAVRWT